MASACDEFLVDGTGQRPLLPAERKDDVEAKRQHGGED